VIQIYQSENNKKPNKRKTNRASKQKVKGLKGLEKEEKVKNG